MSAKNKRIYLDHASTTPVDERVKREMDRFWNTDFGNPGAIYKEGVVAKKAVTEARKKCSDFLRAHTDEIIFTSGGTEANNLAIFGAIKAFKKKNPFEKIHIITSKIEHPSILEPIYELEKLGAKITFVGVDENGIVNREEIAEALRPETILVSIMYANNEIGSIQPIQEIAKAIRYYKKKIGGIYPIFHTDASQAPLYLPIEVPKLGIDLMTLDAQKIYGPKGVGLLFKKKGITLGPIILGGGQENSFRSGTENVPLIAGLTKALEIAVGERENESWRLLKLRDFAIKKILTISPKIKLNGGTENRLSNNINISIPGIDAQFVVLQLDAKGIACSSKSTCLRDEDDSYVIRALGKGGSEAQSSLRFTLGRSTTKKDIEYLVKFLSEII